MGATGFLHHHPRGKAPRRLGSSFFFFLFINLFIYFWPCWVFVAARSLSLVAVSGLLIEVASPAAEHRL